MTSNFYSNPVYKQLLSDVKRYKDKADMWEQEAMRLKLVNDKLVEKINQLQCQNFQPK